MLYNSIKLIAISVYFIFLLVALRLKTYNIYKINYRLYYIIMIEYIAKYLT